MMPPGPARRSPCSTGSSRRWSPGPTQRCQPIADTVKQVVVDERDRRLVTATIDRSDLVAVQTPQAFRRSALVEAHRSGGDATDDAGLVERCGGTVVVVDGETAAHKITTRHDLRFIAGVLELEQ